ncbi:hypothetical protein ACIP6Q_32600 [Streptomyces bobili]|uniref:hypothetical protein n=1 Tax=Streptomyces bobili TaxID=67280 RepID=UPI0038272582
MTRDMPASLHDAMTARDLPQHVDVTYWPLRVEEYLRKTDSPLHRAMLRIYYRHLLLELPGHKDAHERPAPRDVVAPQQAPRRHLTPPRRTARD